MTSYLVDNSVWQRLRTPSLFDAYDALLAADDTTDVLICDVQVAEIGFSARNTADHQRLVELLGEFTECPASPSTADVLDLQGRLWTSGLVRAVGAVDVVIAAYALANDATVLHHDSDFEHIARVEPLFRHRWAVPRGSL